MSPTTVRTPNFSSIACRWESGAIRRNQAQSSGIKRTHTQSGAIPHDQTHAGAADCNHAQSGTTGRRQLVAPEHRCQPSAIRRNYAQSGAIKRNRAQPGAIGRNRAAASRATEQRPAGELQSGAIKHNQAQPGAIRRNRAAASRATEQRPAGELQSGAFTGSSSYTRYKDRPQKGGGLRWQPVATLIATKRNWSAIGQQWAGRSGSSQQAGRGQVVGRSWAAVSRWVVGPEASAFFRSLLAKH